MKRRKQKTPEERLALITQIKDKRAQGASLVEALTEAGISQTTFHKWRRAGAPQKRRRAATYRQVQLESAPPLPRIIDSGQVEFVRVRGSAEQIAALLSHGALV